MNTVSFWTRRFEQRANASSALCVVYFILCHVFSFLACEQALLFGRVKRVLRERASERRSREGHFFCPFILFYLIVKNIPNSVTSVFK